MGNLRRGFARRAISGLVACAILAGCSSGDSTKDVAQPTTTVSTRRPTIEDLRRLLPTPQSLQDESAGAGGYYKPAGLTEFTDAGPDLSWAKGLENGLEQRFTFKSVNDGDPMKVHTAKATLRALVFDSEQDAIDSVVRYRAKMGRAVVEQQSVCGGATVFVLYDVTSEKLRRFSEVVSQVGAIVTLMTYQDSSTVNWGSTAISVTEAYAERISQEFPVLSSTRSESPIRLNDSILSEMFPDKEYLNAVTDYFGGRFVPRGDRGLPADDESLSWATGVLSAREFSHEFEWKKAMSTRPPTMTVRSIAFATPADAIESIGRYEKAEESRRVSSSTGTLENWRSVSRTASFVAIGASKDVRAISEEMYQAGSVIAWVTVQNPVGPDWSSVTFNIANQYLSNIFSFDSALACSS